ncbi:MAG TPA: DMT family transporter [Stellaceae bacterium]|jgi:drug/metabolite transporter (DMT)-like permease
MVVSDRTVPARAHPPGIVYVYLTIVVLTWAANWVMMKFAIGEVPPLSFVALRLIGSLVLVAPPLLLARQGLVPRQSERWGLFWVGITQVVGFLICSIIGLSIVPAGRAIVLGYTMPLWAIPIGLFLWPEPFGRRELVGAGIGFAGLVLFMNPGLVDWSSPRILGGNALLLAAAILWAVGSCLYRLRVWHTPFWVQTFWQLAVSTPPAIVAALIAGGTMHLTPVVVAILVYNCIVTTALGYFLWSKVLSMMPAAMAGQFMTLTPICGFILSTIVFGGAVTVDVLAAIALIVAGIVITLRR